MTEIDAVVAGSRQARAVPRGATTHVQRPPTAEGESRPCTPGGPRPPTSAARPTGNRGVGALAAFRAHCKGMRPLAVLPDNITTDHLSPSNAILPDSAAGEYLAKMGLPEEDFNSYATHRGDHLTAMRATFANPKLFNEMVKNPDGTVKQGSLARVEPEGQVMRMWEAIETYMNRKPAADHRRRGRLRPRLQPRLGRQGRAPGRCGSHRGRRL